jgi:hypothetical protein
MVWKINILLKDRRRAILLPFPSLMGKKGEREREREREDGEMERQRERQINNCLSSTRRFLDLWEWWQLILESSFD